MDKKHQQIVTRHTRVLQEGIIPLPGFYAGLIENEVFTDEMVEEIQAEKTASEQNLKVLSMLKQRGPQAFHKFIEVLQTSGHEDLADILRSAESQVNLISSNPSDKIDEFLSKNLAVNKRLTHTDRRLLLNSVVLKDDFLEEKKLRKISEDEKVELNFKVKKLEKDMKEINSKLDTTLGINKQRGKTIEDLKTEVKNLENTKDYKDTEIRLLKQEVKDLKQGQGQPTNSSLFSQEEVIQNQKELIDKLQKKLQTKEGEYSVMQGELTDQIEHRDKKIKQINDHLSALTKNGDGENENNNLTESELNMLLIEKNIEFLAKKIDSLQKQLVQTSETVANLQEEEALCKELMGFSTDENSLLENVKRFLEENEQEKERQQQKMHNLKAKLHDMKSQMVSLKKLKEELELDKETLKTSVRELKRKVINARYGARDIPSRESSASSRSDDSFVGHLPTLHNTSHRLQKLHPSKSDSNMLTLSKPNTVNLKYEGARQRTNRARHLSIDIPPESGPDKYIMCIRCRQDFRPIENIDGMCRYHPQHYGPSMWDKQTKRWQCCFKACETAAGCLTGKHIADDRQEHVQFYL